MYYYKSLFNYYKTKRPNSEVVAFNHPSLDIYKGKRYLGNVCTFVGILTNKTDYDGNAYQDFVLYDSTGDGPIYSERNYGKRITLKKWLERTFKLTQLQYRVSMIYAQCGGEE